MRRHHPLALAAALLAAGSAAAAGSPGDPPASAGPGDAGARTAPREGAEVETLATLDGVVSAVDLAGHEVTIDVGGKPVVLGLDRNTLVYLPAGLSSVFALEPGDVVRAGRDAAFRAYFIQVRSLPDGGGATPSTPGQGGPGGGTTPPQEGSAPGPTTR